MGNWTACCHCNRGGNGNDKDKCACGWKETEPSGLGCYLGTAIIGEAKPRPKLTRSQRQYREWLRSDCGVSFGEWLGCGEKKRGKISA